MEEGIVIQLQAEAINESVDIETLLRKAYLVARKLQLTEFEKWISCEQNGYKDNIPDYRIIGGEIKAWNPYHGWIPVVFDGKTSDIFNKMPVALPIAAISDVYNDSNGNVGFTVPGEIAEILNKSNGFMPTKYSFQASKSELRKIISAVRNRILDWSILLEENGIVGEGLRFTDDELRTAHESHVINNYTSNLYSNADNTQIQQGGDGNQQQ